MRKDHWHYPRTEFARTVYSLLANGPIHGVSLFGPRRTGKTQFLTNDLAPLAEKKGHRVVYASLWQTLESPLAILLYEFDQALRSGSFADRISSLAGSIAPKFKVKSPDGTGEIEVDLSRLKGKPPESHLLLLDQYCERLADDKHPTFLLLDEFQELARSKESAALVAALRTSLDRRKSGLVSVFSGSSQEGLRRVFSARQAPFYRFATPVDLPAMDEAFVDHQLAAFKLASRAKVARKKAVEVFHQFDASPMFFQRWLMALAINPAFDEDDAIESVQAQMAEEFSFGERWLGLSQTQRLTARMIAEQVDQIYGAGGAEFIEQLTGRKPPGSSALQSAIKRLSRIGIVEKWDREWRISDPLFQRWIRDRHTSEF